MNPLDEQERQRTMSLLGLRAFPRSVGMLAAAITLLAMGEPYSALVVWVVAWFAAYWLRSMLSPSIVDTNLWSCCSLPVNVIGAYPIRWVLFIGMVAVALFMGAPVQDTLLVMGVILAVDVVIVFVRGP